MPHGSKPQSPCLFVTSQFHFLALLTWGRYTSKGPSQPPGRGSGWEDGSWAASAPDFPRDAWSPPLAAQPSTWTPTIGELGLPSTF